MRGSISPFWQETQEVAQVRQFGDAEQHWQIRYPSMHPFDISWGGWAEPCGTAMQGQPKMKCSKPAILQSPAKNPFNIEESS